MKLLNNDIEITKYKISTRKIAPKKQIRIVLVSDLHSNPKDVRGKLISKMVLEQKPDIIALCGDIADAIRPCTGAMQFVEEVCKIAPVYYVTGNHECRFGRYNEIIEAFRLRGVALLNNEYQKIQVNGADIIIGGVDDPFVGSIKPELDWEEEFFKAFSSLNAMPEYKILLSHRPELVALYKKTPFDLILSGHAHGGQVRIPGILNGLYAPSQGLFPRYAGGLYNHGGKTHIVSRGISYKPMPRILNPPELVTIDIIGE